MPEIAWLLLTYRIPPEPAAKRMAVWRKLKAMGAVYLQGGVCLLPRTDEHLRRLKSIDHDIAAAGGESVLLAAEALDPMQGDRVVARFKADRDAAYEEFLDKCDDFEREVAKEVTANHFTFAELEENEADLKKLTTWLRKINTLDFYGAARADEAAQRLARCGEVLEDYARRVFEVEDGK
ncbi:Chromate resistance protein ChrB [Frigidibacter sp. ROC022]|uniref:Chromate resistance protein ChrB n=1 Tax=Frigidibacter sp. ROC022 TaxID=2971796 RepID=UPI00215AE06F|nr:Chromate resistance protein ChrB [Frigidibacter sp. ROC022]MCR8722939.1 hypothetical protein [Frigidibacter sp. ROC022]